jgi:hypothetical protein
MRPDLRNIYNEFLMSASDAVKRRDRHAAMFCLSHAMRCANTVKADARYRKAVFRAMSFARRIEG